MTLTIAVACARQESSKKKIFVFESDPSKSKSFAHIYDKDLDDIGKVDLNTYLIGQKFQNISKYGDKLVLACNQDRESDQYSSSNFLMLNNEKLEFDKLSLKYGSLDTIAVDDSFVYGSSQE